MLTSRKLGLTLAAVLAVGVASPAIAQAPKDPRLATFKANDKNKDGELAKEEFSVVARSYGFGDKADVIFLQSDKNKDTFLQDTEFLAALDAGNKLSTQVVTAAPATPSGPPPNAPPAIKVLMNFKAHDANKDSKLAKDEYQALAKAQSVTDAEALWTSVNKDKDAFITEPEIVASLNSTPGMRIVTAGSGPMTEEQRMAAFKANDKNKDGKLSKDEFAEILKAQNFPGPVDPLFAQRDADKDGFVSEAEFKAPAQPLMIQRPQ